MVNIEGSDAKKMKIDIPNGVLLGMGNPLLDICVSGQPQLLEKYKLEPNNAILADESHVPMYPEMAEMEGVEYIAGGATQNSIRVAQWLLRSPQSTVFFGAIGQDDFGKTLESKAAGDGVNVRYQKHQEHATGTCAVVVTKNGTCRSLVANLAAANHFTKSHIELPENKALIENAKFYYISGFFLTVSPESILAVGEHACKENKVFCMNLSAPFLCQFFKEPMMKAFPYIDILFGNESEAAEFAKEQGLSGKSVADIALEVSKMPKANAQRPRIVVFTQGADEVVLATEGKITEFPVTKLSADKLKDTNGAGDAFVGGFLSQLVLGRDTAACIQCGIWAATEVIQRSGCTFDTDMMYKP